MHVGGRDVPTAGPACRCEEKQERYGLSDGLDFPDGTAQHVTPESRFAEQPRNVP